MLSNIFSIFTRSFLSRQSPTIFTPPLSTTSSPTLHPTSQVASKASELVAAERDRIYRALKRGVSDAVKNELCALLGMAVGEPKKKQRAVQMLFQPGACVWMVAMCVASHERIVLNGFIESVPFITELMCSLMVWFVVATAAGLERVSIVFLTRLTAACAPASASGNQDGDDDADDANRWPRASDRGNAPQLQRAARLLAAAHAVAAALLVRPSPLSARPPSHPRSLAAAAGIREESARLLASGGATSAAGSAASAASTDHCVEIESMSRRLAQMESALADAQNQLKSQSQSMLASPSPPPLE
jgi:hypothetical protein